MIDDILGNNLGRTFPVVDKLENGVLTSIKSMDTALKSYQTAEGVFNKLACYIRALGNFTEREWQGVTVHLDDYSLKVLELAIPNRILSGEQVTGIIQAIQMAAKLGIQLILKVVE